MSVVSHVEAFPVAAKLNEFKVLKHMDSNYPATFLWHTKTDETIPFELNYVPFVEELEKWKIPHKAKIVENGGHGLGLGSGTEAEGWLEEAVEYWKKL